MQEFNEGDLVEAVHGETVIRGRLISMPAEGPEPMLKLTLVLWSDMAHLKANGFTVTTIEKAAPKLPTEMGWYLTNTGDAVFLAADGYWTTPSSFGVTGEDMGIYGPFIRLEPVPVTAKKVLDAIRQRIGSIDSAHDFQAVAAEFGVTE